MGKSTVAVNLAFALAKAGKSVGLLDVDIHGPSVPKLLNLEGAAVTALEKELLPVERNGLKVMSIGFLLPDGDHAVIWRGPLKMQLIRQFLSEVKWGKLDFLVVDCPPGTGDEPLSVVQLIKDVTGAVIVTTPQDVAIVDVRKCVKFCETVKVPVLGVIENMSGFVCPKCGEKVEIFKRGGGERMARDMGIPFLGAVPLDPRMVEAGDDGTPFLESYGESETARAFDEAIRRLLESDSSPGASGS